MVEKKAVKKVVKKCAVYKCGVRNVSSRMRHFLQEFSVEPPHFLEAVC